MIDKLAANITGALIDNEIVTKEDCEIYEYGINLILSGFAGGLIIIILSLIMGKIEFGIMFLGVIIPVRMYTGGYHADTHIMCNFVFSMVYIFSIVLYDWLVSLNLEIFIWLAALISVVIVSCMAPLENSNKPITKNEKRKFKKISICLCVGVFAIVKIFEQQYPTILYMNVVLVMVAMLLIVGLIKIMPLSRN